MARPKYSVTAQDLLHVELYVSTKLRNYGIELAEDVFTSDAEQAFNKVRQTEGGKVKRAKAVNAWCEQFLSTLEWNKLKAALRKRRERWARCEELTTITVSARAHSLLKQLSARDGVTLSKALEHYLPKALNAARGRAKRLG